MRLKQLGGYFHSLDTALLQMLMDGVMSRQYDGLLGPDDYLILESDVR